MELSIAWQTLSHDEYWMAIHEVFTRAVSFEQEYCKMVKRSDLYYFRFGYFISISTILNVFKGTFLFKTLRNPIFKDAVWYFLIFLYQHCQTIVPSECFLIDQHIYFCPNALF